MEPTNIACKKFFEILEIMPKLNILRVSTLREITYKPQRVDYFCLRNKLVIGMYRDESGADKNSILCPH